MAEYKITSILCARCKKTVTGILHLTGAGVKAAGLGTVKLEKEPGAALLFLLLNM